MPKRKRSAAKSRKRADDVVSKTRLAEEIKKVVDEKGLTQTKAATVAKEAQSQMSLVMSGHLQGFSANRLIRILLRLGRNVEIRISKKTGRAAGKVSIKGTR